MADATIRGYVAQANTGNNTVTVNPAAATNPPVAGDWLVLGFEDTSTTSATPGTNNPTTSLTDWVILVPRTKMGTRSITWLARKVLAGETSYQFTNPAGSAYINTRAIWGPGGDAIANWEKTALQVGSSVGTTMTATGFTPSKKSLVLALFGLASATSGQTDAQNTVASPWTKVAWTTNWTTTIVNSLFVASIAQTAQGAVADAVYTHSGASTTTNQSAFLLAIPTLADATPPSIAVSTPADGSTVTNGRTPFTGTATAGSAITLTKTGGATLGTTTATDGTWSITPTADLTIGSASYTVTATLNGLSTSVSVTVTYNAPPVLNWWTGTAIEKRNAFWWDGTQIRNIGTPVMLHRGRKVDEFFTGPRPPVVAHRCGSADFYEHNLMGATRCLVAGVAALEISVAVTSDGVFLGAHDATADRTTPAVSGFTFSAHTWSEVQALTQTVPTGNDPVYGAAAAAPPYYRLTDFLNAYAESHTIFIDPKVLTASQRQNLYALLRTYPNYQNTFVGKYYHTGTNIADEFHAFGCKVWGYAYQADVDGTGPTQLGTTVTKWDWLGMDYNASDDAWTTTRSYGRPILVHITPTYANALSGLNRGATGIMASGVNEVMRGFTA